MTKTVWKKVSSIFQQYSVVVAGLLIYSYYLATTMNFFDRSHNAQMTFLDFVLQFDSLIWMWVTAFVVVKLQQVKQKQFEETQARQNMQTQIEKSAIASHLLKDITMQLQDTINNPLAIISTVTEDIRRKHVVDPELVRKLDQIDASLQRIHNAIKDVRVYQTEQLLESVQQNVGSEK